MFQPQTFQPLRYVPASRQAAVNALPVLRILATPHTQTGVRTNHWCFYLQTGGDTSVRIDCQPSYSIPSTSLPGGSKAFLIVSELAYLMSRDVQAIFYLDVIQGLTVAHIVDTLCQYGRHKYEFDASGVGCRYWTTNQIDLFHQAGYVHDLQQSMSAKAAILELWPEQTPLALDQGAYYE